MLQISHNKFTCQQISQEAKTLHKTINSSTIIMHIVIKGNFHHLIWFKIVNCSQLFFLVLLQSLTMKMTKNFMSNKLLLIFL